MSKPTFICIGTQKGGTNSLNRLLQNTPDVFMKYEEMHFFDKHIDEKITQTDIDWYENKLKTDKLIVGEKTPSYSYLLYSLNSIQSFYPNIKIIFIIREPISRVISQYNMECSRDKNIKNRNEIDELIINNNHTLNQVTCNGKHYIIRGFYDEIIEHLYSLFPKENICISVSEEIRSNQEEEYNRILDFLGSDSTQVDTKTPITEHVRKSKLDFSINTKQYLYDIYKDHNEKLYKILGRKIKSWERYYEVNKLI